MNRRPIAFDPDENLFSDLLGLELQVGIGEVGKSRLLMKLRQLALMYGKPFQVVQKYFERMLSEDDIKIRNGNQTQASNQGTYAKENPIMNRVAVAKELVAIAKSIDAEWKSLVEDVDISMRNKEMLRPVAVFAPQLGRELRSQASQLLARDGYAVTPNELKRVWSTLLTYIDAFGNKNKYHYYGIYEFTDGERTLYVGMNMSGRIGIFERAYDLTKKVLNGPARSFAEAKMAVDTHMKTKLRDGYQVSPFKA